MTLSPLARLRRDVYQANMALAASGLVLGTFGNVSGIDRQRGWVAIKPSGVPYEQLTAGRIAVVELASGKKVAGDLRPSSDLPTHLELYRAWATIGGVVHTHSLYATAWAQTGRAIPALGTTHADHFFGAVPCTRPLRAAEIKSEYEANTGRMIVEGLALAGVDPQDMPAALVASHGPFAWGSSAAFAVENAILLEYIAAMATETLTIRPAAKPISSALLNKHYRRKHGPDATYGQKR
jgi:L-ribulose-5-phosphate 4-epimerase